MKPNANIQVRYFDGKSSDSLQGELTPAGPGRLSLKVGDWSREYAWEEIDVSEPLGNTPRSLRFPDGGLAETDELAALGELIPGRQAKSRMVHRLESRWRYVLASLVLLVAALWAFIAYGVPLIAAQIAHAIPIATERQWGEQTLDVLDGWLFEPSALDPDRQAHLNQLFVAQSSDLDEAFDFHLVFRASPVIGPNAFALPGGYIILTDELVAIAANDYEIQAILAHEMGHVVERHLLRQALRSSITGLLLLTITGDVATASSALVAALPTILIEAGFSRSHELEADRYAHDLMQKHGIPLESFPNMLHRLGDAVGADPDESGYLSSHPSTHERERLFR